MSDPDAALHELDAIEGFIFQVSLTSAHVRSGSTRHLSKTPDQSAWTYFYNAPLGGAQRIESGDYLDHLRIRR